MDLLSQTMQDHARVKIERALSFSGGTTEMEGHILPKKMRTPRDQMSHRIIEKRRRDRMNNCLANLGQLIPVNYLKQGQGRIEKTEIIELATQHITQLQTQVKGISSMDRTCCQEKFLMGYKECRDEVMRFLVEMAGYEAADPFCLMLLKHLHNQSKKFVPESATSVYHSQHSPHAGTNNNGEFTMRQNAGEVGGLNRMWELNNENHDTFTSPANVPLKKNLTPSIPIPTPSWNDSSANSMQKNIYTDVNQYLNIPQQTTTSTTRHCNSDSGYSTTQSSRNNLPIAPSAVRASPPQSSFSNDSSLPANSSPDPNSGGTSNFSMSPETVLSDSSRAKRRPGYKYKNYIQQKFSSLSSEVSDKAESSLSAESAHKQSTTEATEKSDRDSNPGNDTSSGHSEYTSTISSGNGSSTTPSSPSSHSGSSPHTADDDSSYKKAKMDSSFTNHRSSSTSSNDCKNDYANTDSHQVPAFALHPLGTCYIPMVISSAIMGPFLREHSTPLGICHPVSIPVHFSRPDQIVVRRDFKEEEGGKRVESMGSGNTEG